MLALSFRALRKRHSCHIITPTEIMLFWKQRKNLSILIISALFSICLRPVAHGQIIYESAPHHISEHNLNIIEQNGMLGVTNGKGNVVVPALYQKIRINKDNSISGLPLREWSILDGDNNFITKVNYDTIAPVAQNLLKVGHGNKEGLADSQGNLISELREWQIFSFQDQYALVKEGDKYGIINAGGSLTVPLAYDTLILGEDYLVGMLQKEGRKKEWHALQYSGEVLFKRACDALHIGNQGYFSFLENSSWGFLNYKGERTIPNQYDTVHAFINGRAIAHYMGSDGVINRSGEWVIRPRKDRLKHLMGDIYIFYSQNGSGLISVSKGELFTTPHEFIPLNHGFLEKNEKGQYGLISPEGQRLLITAYDEISGLQNDTVYLFRKGEQWGFVTKAGQIKSEFKTPIQAMYPMGDQFIGVKIDHKYGFIDTNGDLRIANRYEAIGQFHENMAAVKLMGRWGYIDRIERLFVQPRYDQASDFENGCAIVGQGGLYGLVGTRGDEILKIEYDSLYRLPSGRFLLIKDGRQGLASQNGSLRIRPRYDEVVDLDNGYVLIRRGGKYGLLTSNGVNTIPLAYDSLVYSPHDKVYFASKSPAWQQLMINQPK